MRLIPGSAQHIGSRQQQQDAFGFSNLAQELSRAHGGMLAVVADGMGGMAHGDAASRCALKAFLEAYEGKTEAESVPDALLRAILTANAAVYQLALEMGSAEDMGTTLIAVVLKNAEMNWISAGDSAIFVYRDAEFTQVNCPHNFGVQLDEQVSQGAISREVGLAHPEREALTSFLGLARVAMVDRSIRPFTLRENDIVLLASDGLFKTLTFEQMAEAMKCEAAEISAELVKRTIAAARQYQDNVTVVSISAEVEKPPVPVRPPRKSGTIRKWALLPILLAVLALAAGGYFYYTSIQQGNARPVPRKEK